MGLGFSSEYKLKTRGSPEKLVSQLSKESIFADGIVGQQLLMGQVNGYH